MAKAKFVIYTNNPLVKDTYGEKCDVAFFDEDYMQLLTRIRDLVHSGHRLLTHPLAGSIKPNETPFKSVFLTTATGPVDQQSISIIEETFATCRKFGKSRFPDMSDAIRTDFSVIDCSLVENALPSASQL